MANTYGIPSDIEHQLRARDKLCVYCHLRMKVYRAHGPSGDKATIEHLNHRARWGEASLGNLAICCGRCNSSRSNKRLAVWLASLYCEERGINARTVAPVVKRFLRLHPRG